MSPDALQILAGALIEITPAILSTLADRPMSREGLATELAGIRSGDLLTDLESLIGRGIVIEAAGFLSLAQCDAPDWRPEETLPEDYYA